MFTLTSPCFSRALPMDYSIPKLRHHHHHHPSPLSLTSPLSSSLSFSSSSFLLPSIRASSSPSSSVGNDDEDDEEDDAFRKPRYAPFLQTLLRPGVKTTCNIVVALSIAILFSTRSHHSPFLPGALLLPPLEERLSSNRGGGGSSSETKTIDELLVRLDSWIALQPEKPRSGSELRPPKTMKLHMYDGSDAMVRMAYEDILKKDPFNVKAYEGLVIATLDSNELGGLLKRIEEAAKACKELQREDSDSDSRVRELGLLIAQIRWRQRDISAALEAYKELAEEDPTDFRPYYWQSVIYTLAGNKDEAQRQFDKFRMLAPKDHPYERSSDDWPLPNRANVQEFLTALKKFLSGSNDTA